MLKLLTVDTGGHFDFVTGINDAGDKQLINRRCRYSPVSVTPAIKAIPGIVDTGHE
jgi:hypothetical protein